MKEEDKFTRIVADTREYLLREDYTNLCFFGPRARGMAHRIKYELRDDISFVDVNGEIPEVNSQASNIVYCLDRATSDIDLDELKGKRCVVIDESEHVDSKKGYCSIKADYFIDNSISDIDPGISRLVSELYINVFDAFVNYENIQEPTEEKVVDLKNSQELTEEKVPFYFRTAELIDYSRSRVILEGLIASVAMKFKPDYIASRELCGIKGKNEVRMYDLAERVAKIMSNEGREVDSLKIEDIGNNDPDWMKKHTSYIIKNNENKNLDKKKIMILDDVLRDGSQKEELAKAVRYTGADPYKCVVLLDRMESNLHDFPKDWIYAMTDVETFRDLAINKGIITMKEWIQLSKNNK